jgi:porin
MKPISFPLALTAALHAVASTGSFAAPAEPSGEPTLWTRETLTDDWGGQRASLANRGVVLDLSTTGYYAGLLEGDGDKDFEWGGRSDALLHLNTGKLGLWEGGGFHAHFESRYGESADRTAPRSGGLWPPNTGVAVPLGNPDRVVTTSLFYSHGFNESASLMLGKINAFDLLAADPFFGGGARERFTNTAFVAPPSGVVPPTLMGGIFSYRFKPYSITLMVFDPNDQTNNYSVNNLFEDGENISLGGTWTGHMAGRSSSMNVTGTYSTQRGTDLSDFLLPIDQTIGTKKGSYNVSYSVSHLLYELSDAPGKGFGVYAKAAIGDGNPNPIQSSFIGGFAGHGVVPGRPLDVFGIGYYFYNLSDDLQEETEAIFPIDDEAGVEIYYNFALTPWLRITPDVQWIEPANPSISDSWVAGVRANLSL